ncbi:CRISPR-associated endoribonuclease Cas6 [Clostridium tetani]|uniref:CRISPR-associated endoribonuclease Cas6 n=1 Tax=Clostridium tetani TaxID=1513 RepID=A0A4V1LET5_CLOTA|nr:CRISPR-associated endoribonuclease Cas6 [Clostridium tetani]RXI38103.1 CRISPR-associated endoribonuclease Cas6 [Clostridium tetani]RXI49346.1 CRISPR-associated endoribonuclease Cas6 [Clostridium tetani]
MKIYELTLKVFLLKDIKSDESLEKISNLIDKSLSKDGKLLDFHERNTYKNYTFNSLYPIEKDKIYCEGKIYSVQIRTIDESLVQYFKKNLTNEYTEYIKALTLECRVIPQRYIEKIYSITPVIIKTEKGYWKGNLSLGEFEERIKNNLIKKYNAFFNTKIDERFTLFRAINLINNKPISCSYKNINVLGDKVNLVIDENEMAQKLAYFSLGTSIGEMNARGYGFVNYKWI